MTTWFSPDGKVVPGVVLVKPNGEPYEAIFSNQTFEGGELNTSDLATHAKQDQQIAATNAVADALAEPLNVEIQNTSFPLADGAATSANQSAIIAALNAQYALLGSSPTVNVGNTSLGITAASLPLPTGAATANNQEALYALLGSGLDVEVTNTPTVNIGSMPDVGVVGEVEITNPSLPVTLAQPVTVSSITSPVTVQGTVAATGTVNVGNPVQVTDGAGATASVVTSAPSSGAAAWVVRNIPSGVQSTEVTNFPTSTQVSNFPATQAVTQSGTWNVGARDSSGALVNALTDIPAADARGLVTRNIPSGTQTVSGTVNAAVTNFPATQAVSLASVPTHPVTQSGTWTVTSNPAAPSATGSALTAYRNAALSNTAQVVKASAGRVLNYHLANMNSAAVYVHFYNAASGVTVGTTIPLVTLAVPANSVLDGAWVFSFGFSNGIMMAATTGAANATAPTAGILTMIGYV